MEKARKPDPSEGILEFLDGNGIKRFELNFSNGQKHGTFKLWHENGQLLLEDNFEDGNPLANTKVWRSDGTKERG